MANLTVGRLRLIQSIVDDYMDLSTPCEINETLAAIETQIKEIRLEELSEENSATLKEITSRG